MRPFCYKCVVILTADSWPSLLRNITADDRGERRIRACTEIKPLYAGYVEVFIVLYIISRAYLFLL